MIPSPHPGLLPQGEGETLGSLGEENGRGRFIGPDAGAEAKADSRGPPRAETVCCEGWSFGWRITMKWLEGV